MGEYLSKLKFRVTKGWVICLVAFVVFCFAGSFCVNNYRLIKDLRSWCRELPVFATQVDLYVLKTKLSLNAQEQLEFSSIAKEKGLDYHALSSALGKERAREVLETLAEFRQSYALHEARDEAVLISSALDLTNDQSTALRKGFENIYLLTARGDKYDVTLREIISALYGRTRLAWARKTLLRETLTKSQYQDYLKLFGKQKRSVTRAGSPRKLKKAETGPLSDDEKTWLLLNAILELSPEQRTFAKEALETLKPQVWLPVEQSIKNHAGEESLAAIVSSS
ncbi:MAG TPA: hypothetical protein PLP17_07910, partial [Oligoflexia bacterium]|nr:hypothetical protein [Oligoflexia bacterium]